MAEGKPETGSEKLETHSPLIIAHRGASARSPENTLAAFRGAFDSGADGVEFDVRLSKDGVPVVIHDASLVRTAGVSGFVADLTAEQLSRVDAGSWFNAAYPAYARQDFASEGIPSLRTVLQLLETAAGPIYIELKCETEIEASLLVDAVCREIGNSVVLERVIVKSFQLGVISRARTILPGLRTAALFAPKVMRLLRKEKYLIDIARDLGADHLSLHKSLVSGKLIRKAERYGMPVTVWTVDAPRWITWAADHGLFAIITNYPSRMLASRDAKRRPPAHGNR